MNGAPPVARSWGDAPSLVGGPSLLQAMWRRRVLLVAAAIIGFAVGYLLSSTQPAVYSATATVFLTDPSEAELFSISRVDPERHVQQEAGRMQARAVFSRAADIIDDERVGPTTVAGSVNVSSNIAVGLVSVTAMAGSPERAAEIANGVVVAYEQLSGEDGREALDAATAVLRDQTRGLQEQADQLQARLRSNPDDAAASSTLQAVQAQLTALRTRLSEVATEIAIYGSGVDSVERAMPPAGPSGPDPVRDGIVAAALGLALASAYAYWRAGTARSAQGDVGEILDAPLLAEIPKFKLTDATKLLFDAQATEAYQFIVPSLNFAMAQLGGRSVLITSAAPGEGKSLTALHLTRALAMQGRRVALVDSDLHTQGLSTWLQAEDESGLAELSHGGRLHDVVRSYRISSDAQLALVPAGNPPNPPTGILSTAGCRAALQRIFDTYELTIVDSEPLLTVADVAAVAQQVAGIILVVDAQTSPESLKQVRERLRLAPAPLLGYVLNRLPTSQRSTFLTRTSDSFASRERTDTPPSREQPAMATDAAQRAQ